MKKSLAILRSWTKFQFGITYDKRNNYTTNVHVFAVSYMFWRISFRWFTKNDYEFSKPCWREWKDICTDWQEVTQYTLLWFWTWE